MISVQVPAHSHPLPRLWKGRRATKLKSSFLVASLRLLRLLRLEPLALSALGEQILWLASLTTWCRDACSPRRGDAVGEVGAAAPRRGRVRGAGLPGGGPEALQEAVAGTREW